MKVAELPYFAALKFVQKISPVQVWARNSFVLGTHKPFLSDLDLTIFFESSPDEKLCRAVLRSYSVGKLLFPFIGETNIYIGDDLGLVHDLINPWELSRDPQLNSIMQIEGLKTNPTPHHGAVFLLRMLESDFKNLTTRPQQRIRKWTGHFNEIFKLLKGHSCLETLRFDEKNIINSVFNAALRLSLIMDPVLFADAKAWLELYLEIELKSVAQEKLAKLISLPNWWWAYFPHQFCLAEVPSPKIEPSLLGIFVGQIEWELFGILTQYLQTSDRRPYLAHISRLKNIVERASVNNPSDSLKTLLYQINAIQTRLEKRQISLI